MIQVQRLTKCYEHTPAVDELSFEVRPGRVTGFLGPNGAGKSTTMRVIVGLDAPDFGKALVNDRPYSELGWPLREVGAHLDAKTFHPGRSAEAHLLALAQASAIDRSRVTAVLDVVGLSSVARRRAGTFSTGMAQRLGIAAALLGDSGVLLFDEPINGLDPEGIRWFRKVVRGLAAEGRTVLLSSHLISEMALTADWLVVIGRGHLVVATGGTALDPEVITQLLEASHRGAALNASLTPRESEVLALMAEGRSNSAIADAFVVGEGAVEKHVANIFAKLGLPISESDNRRVLAVLRYLEQPHPAR